jgi:hypothetical protein
MGTQIVRSEGTGSTARARCLSYGRGRPGFLALGSMRSTFGRRKYWIWKNNQAQIPAPGRP